MSYFLDGSRLEAHSSTFRIHEAAFVIRGQATGPHGRHKPERALPGHHQLITPTQQLIIQHGPLESPTSIYKLYFSITQTHHFVPVLLPDRVQLFVLVSRNEPLGTLAEPGRLCLEFFGALEEIIQIETQILLEILEPQLKANHEKVLEPLPDESAHEIAECSLGQPDRVEHPVGELEADSVAGIRCILANDLAALHAFTLVLML